MPEITIDLASKLPPVRALHGVNNGPIGYGALVDVSHHYRSLQIPLARLHDPNWPHPREVDIPQVFPDFGADPEDEGSYRFGQTDDYIQRILDTGAKVVYRLGVSIEHTPRKYYTAPPADPQKWARICQGIVRHYNCGWAKGFRHGIRYWEIWNEADLDERMWGGSYEEYLELYRYAATAVRAADPTVRVGGPAIVYCRSPRLTQFLEFCRSNALPLDFVSWHAYRTDPRDIAQEGRFVRELLEKYGLGHVESHLNEWNYIDFDWDKIWVPGNEQLRREAFERQKNEVGASFVAAALMLMQDAGVDVACYYDGQPSALFCGLFDYYGVPQKTFHAFEAFRRMLGYSQRVAVSVEETSGPVALACISDKADQLALLVSNFGADPSECTIRVQDGNREVNGSNAQVHWVDRDRSLVGGPLGRTLSMPAHSVALVEMGLEHRG